MTLSPLLDLAIEIQQIPAPTFDEAQRAAFVARRFAAEGLPVEQDELGNVYACIRGSGDAAPLVVSAHLDTVFPRETDLRLARGLEWVRGPGIGDNSLGVAGLFGLWWALQAFGARLPGDIWLVANVGEEGLGDLRGMKAVVDRFGAAARAYIVLEGMSLGLVYHRGLSVRRYRLRVQTAGGHSWVDYGQPSAIHELSALVARLAAAALPASPRASLNVGVIGGGVSVNTIAPEAWCDVDLRCEQAGGLAQLAGWVEEQAQRTRRAGVECAAEIIGERPGGEIAAGHPLVQQAMDTLRACGMTPRLNIGSTDANIPLSCGYPAVCVGLTLGGGAHTLNETIQVAPLAVGMEQLTRLAQLAFDISR